MTKLYLAHPTLARKEIREWELLAEKRLGITLDNPFYDGWERADIIKIDNGTETEFSPTLNAKRIVEGDLDKIRHSDGVLAFITPHISVGTFCEIFFAAHVLKKPVYLIITKRKFWSHPWLVYHSNERFRSTKAFEQWWKMNNAIMV